MADRRYKLIKQGLPGGRNFEFGDLADGDIPYWDATNGRWTRGEIGMRPSRDANLEIRAAGASANPGLWFVDSSDVDLSVLYHEESLNRVTLSGRKAGATITISSRNAADSAYHTMLTGDPDDRLSFYFDSTEAARTTGDGFGVLPSSGAGIAALRFYPTGAASTNGLVYHTGTNLAVQNSVAGGILNLYANKTSVGNVSVFYGDPDAESRLYHAGNRVAQTADSGLVLYGNTTDAVLALIDVDNERGEIYKDSDGTLRIINREHGEGVQIYAEDNSGTATLLINSDPETFVSLYYNALLAVATTGDGFAIYSRNDTNTNCVLRFRDASGTSHTQMYHSMTTDDFLLQNLQNSGRLRFFCTNSSGTSREVLYLDGDGPSLVNNTAAGGAVFGSPTGGDKGAGTINAKAVYDDNTLLTDYVFDAAIDGRVDTRKWDDAVPNRMRRVKDATEDEPAQDELEVRRHEPARRFAQRLDDLDPKAYAAKWRATRKLPAFVPEAGEDPQFSVGSIAQRLLETCEVQAVHIDTLLQRIEVLETQVGELRDAAPNDQQTPPTAP